MFSSPYPRIAFLGGHVNLLLAHHNQEIGRPDWRRNGESNGMDENQIFARTLSHSRKRRLGFDIFRGTALECCLRC